ncbi:hypothetical protein NQ317_007571 [Molorchus minor]|uniref:Uncharacterized protein n=1 Tax=Molorchus minor TaxID=1323400 RepID=A0ABQ9IQ41_9CUCU|nr:hypothetical protein NQ317_007571 [Molorchus minor]
MKKLWKSTTFCWARWLVVLPIVSIGMGLVRGCRMYELRNRESLFSSSCL